MSYNAKCNVCGYSFNADENEEFTTCPLCSAEHKTDDILFETEEPEKKNKSTGKSAARLALDWGIFAGGLIAFIIVLYLIFSFLAGK